MQQFASAYAALDATNKTNEKLAALSSYFQEAQPADAAWAAYLLSGNKPRQIVPARRLVEWAIEAAEIQEWMFSECYSAVGDIAETISLLLPEQTSASSVPLHTWIEDRLLPLRTMNAADQRAAVLHAWNELDAQERFVYNKIITGEFRVGVSQRLVIRALAQASGIDAAVLAHRFMGNWQPTELFYSSLLAMEEEGAVPSRPFPFFLAFPLEGNPESLGELSEWQVEWKWDGIRSQTIRRAGQSFVWSRGEELVNDQYPEIIALAAAFPDGTVIDGEILAWKDNAVLPFAQMQRRIGRTKLVKKVLEEAPVILMAYDLLEENGQDVRDLPLSERRIRLENLVQEIHHPSLLLSPLVEAASWEQLTKLRTQSRERNVEGFMLKRKTSPYRVGRQRGDWWKWKVDPYTVDAVLIYAQRGNGKRASLYTDYTFGIWDETGQLVPFAKAYSGLTDEEIREVDAFIRQNTVERFGPVRTVKPELVFELAFAGVQRSARHKSGVAVRFPRILRWRKDKPVQEADTVETVRSLLPEE